VVAALYGRVAGYEFVFDDVVNVVENPRVARGLGWDGLAWAFTETYLANWQPLTWLSHMTDVSVFGMRPAGPHLINVALHAANSALLLLALFSMTGDLWPAAAVAAWFAVHPLRVESVAWISERKDVLGAFFWLLAMLAYARYVRRPGPGRYLVVASLLALGLLAKATLVTLPCVLLLLDLWPLRRWRPRASAWQLAAEKIPLLVLVAAASTATVWAQARGGALQPTTMVPLPARVDNAIVAYVTYLWKAVWPAHLACFYPHPALLAVLGGDTSHVPSRAAVGGALALAAITAGVLAGSHRCPYLLVGWLWYLGTLVPMIGLVQVGQQSLADRYTYLPLIGISVMVAWGLRDLTAGRAARRALAVATVLALAGYAAVTWSQIATWRDGVTLYEHAIRVTRDNFLAHYNLGNALLRQGRVPEAKRHLEEAVRIAPTMVDAHYNLGTILRWEGNLQGAAAHFASVLQMRPDSAGAHKDLGLVLFQQGRFEDAARHFARATELEPGYAEAHNGLGNALLRQGRSEEAAAEFTEALRLRADYAEPHNGLGVMFFERGDLQRAADQFAQALRIDPTHRGARESLARVRALLGEH